MMARSFSIGLMACCMALTVLFAACDTATPQDYFGRAGLSSNLLHDFAGEGMRRQLASPSEKLTDAKTGASAPMKRAEVVADKLASAQASLDKVKALRGNDDANAMIKASLTLYEFVIPVYKNEYQELAALYDGNDSRAAAAKIAALEKSISEKYAAKFQDLRGALIAAGKTYAAKHNIKVREVNPSPSPSSSPPSKPGR